MDQVIFEEFKGTGNMELTLDRNLADCASSPPSTSQKSGTRKEELLMPKEDSIACGYCGRCSRRCRRSRRWNCCSRKMGKTKTNQDFLSSMSSGKKLTPRDPRESLLGITPCRLPGPSQP